MWNWKRNVNCEEKSLWFHFRTANWRKCQMTSVYWGVSAYKKQRIDVFWIFFWEIWICALGGLQSSTKGSTMWLNTLSSHFKLCSKTHRILEPRKYFAPVPRKSQSATGTYGNHFSSESLTDCMKPNSTLEIKFYNLNENMNRSKSNAWVDAEHHLNRTIAVYQPIIPFVQWKKI